ncbi:uncharacterized protein IL334_004013 [Kwoniella shivajii]|uniref:Uncharacterized protein n=1 Tax=Kwoniella shivajii TaxID=564305 RepID=A0ABZ1D384_9TREE|nr:hypothetical protein IL334_004013 [Kwoniella shivajii]
MIFCFIPFIIPLAIYTLNLLSGYNFLPVIQTHTTHGQALMNSIINWFTVTSSTSSHSALINSVDDSISSCINVYPTIPKIIYFEHTLDSGVAHPNHLSSHDLNQFRWSTFSIAIPTPTFTYTSPSDMVVIEMTSIYTPSPTTGNWFELQGDEHNPEDAKYEITAYLTNILFALTGLLKVAQKKLKKCYAQMKSSWSETDVFSSYRMNGAHLFVASTFVAVYIVLGRLNLTSRSIRKLGGFTQRILVDLLSTVKKRVQDLEDSEELNAGHEPTVKRTVTQNESPTEYTSNEQPSGAGPIDRQCDTRESCMVGDKHREIADESRDQHADKGEYPVAESDESAKLDSLPTKSCGKITSSDFRAEPEKEDTEPRSIHSNGIFSPLNPGQSDTSVSMVEFDSVPCFNTGQNRPRKSNKRVKQRNTRFQIPLEVESPAPLTCPVQQVNTATQVEKAPFRFLPPASLSDAPTSSSRPPDSTFITPLPFKLISTPLVSSSPTTHSPIINPTRTHYIDSSEPLPILAKDWWQDTPIVRQVEPDLAKAKLRTQIAAPVKDAFHAQIGQLVDEDSSQRVPDVEPEEKPAPPPIVDHDANSIESLISALSSPRSRSISPQRRIVSDPPPISKDSPPPDRTKPFYATDKIALQAILSPTQSHRLPSPPLQSLPVGARSSPPTPGRLLLSTREGKARSNNNTACDCQTCQRRHATYSQFSAKMTTYPIPPDDTCISPLYFDMPTIKREEHRKETPTGAIRTEVSSSSGPQVDKPLKQVNTPVEAKGISTGEQIHQMGGSASPRPVMHPWAITRTDKPAVVDSQVVTTRLQGSAEDWLARINSMKAKTANPVVTQSAIKKAPDTVDVNTHFNNGKQAGLTSARMSSASAAGPQGEATWDEDGQVEIGKGNKWKMVKKPKRI